MYWDSRVQKYISEDNLLPDEYLVWEPKHHRGLRELRVVAYGADEARDKMTIQWASKLTTKDDNYSLIIVDNGEGISDENREKIFEINFTTKEKGMGLGLKLARRFLEGVNGNIHLVESGSSGTAFEIVIPKYNSSENV